MSYDDIKIIGPLESSKPDAGGAPVRNVPVLGVVKDNVDPNRSGRIWVYIGDNTGLDPDDRSNWTPMSYLSPFFGKTSAEGGQDDYGTFKNNPSSYGYWQSPPDIGTTVVCLFLNGDMNYGFYMGAIPDPDTLHMVPAIGSSEDVILNEAEANSYGGATRLPVTNINVNNPGVTDNGGFLKAPKPVHSYVASIMAQQGVLRDPIRGPISSSAQRESPSRVGWGVATPGRPIYEGGYTDETVVDALNSNTQKGLKVVARRGGHSIVMDDGDIIGRNQLIRIRSALGHQILLSDDGQTLSILHSNGQSYIELGKEGTVDIYSTNSFNVRTQGDINLHADNNININAKKTLNIQAENIKINADKDFQQRTGQNHKNYTLGKYLLKSDSAVSIEGQGDVSLASKGIAYINGTKINLNTGSTSHAVEKVETIPFIAQTDTLFDNQKGFLAAPGKLVTIVTRAPAHMPWANSNQGVEITTSLNASDNLPTPPSPPLQTANQTSEGAEVNQTTVTQSATVPDTPAVSSAIDKNTTSAVLGQMAKDAATGPASEAIKKGVGVATLNGVPTAVVGAFAQTPAQLETNGILKPGSATLINSLVAGGVPVKQAMSSNMFTGAPGAPNLKSLVGSVATQAVGVVRNLQQSQRQLQSFGLLTGREPAVQAAGAVMSGVVNGVSKTMSVINNVQQVSNLISGIGNNTGSGGAVMAAMAAGKFAASLAQSKTGGLNSISQAINAASSVTSAAGLQQAVLGITGAAFNTIAKKFAPMKPGVPQNLLNIAKQSLTTNIATAAVGSALNIPGRSGGSITEMATRVALGTVGSVTGSIASGLGNLPGGQRVAAAVVNSAIGSAVGVPGLGSINLLAAGRSTAALNGIPQASIPNPLAPVANIANALIPGSGNIVNSLVGGGAVNPLNSFTSSFSNLGSSVGQLTNSLSGLAGVGLPASSLAQLTAFTSAVGNGGSTSIRLPTVGINTTNRTSINAQTSALLGDSKIPQPNFSGSINEIAESKYQQELAKQQAESDKRKDNRIRFDAQFAVTKKAKEEFSNALNTLDEGDPQIAELKAKYIEEYKKLLAISNELL